MCNLALDDRLGILYVAKRPRKNRQNGEARRYNLTVASTLADIARVTGFDFRASPHVRWGHHLLCTTQQLDARRRGALSSDRRTPERARQIVEILGTGHPVDVEKDVGGSLEDLADGSRVACALCYASKVPAELSPHSKKVQTKPSGIAAPVISQCKELNPPVSMTQMSDTTGTVTHQVSAGMKGSTILNRHRQTTRESQGHEGDNEQRLVVEHRTSLLVSAGPFYPFGPLRIGFDSQFPSPPDFFDISGQLATTRIALNAAY
ncbi:hypothetical protein B0H11DRAFT_1935528 [Mycena galericulata]|nr:hypothetical protein B0H11DRAFT_1935528 [Mycena galericulata]